MKISADSSSYRIGYFRTSFTSAIDPAKHSSTSSPCPLGRHQSGNGTMITSPSASSTARLRASAAASLFWRRVLLVNSFTGLPAGEDSYEHWHTRRSCESKTTGMMVGLEVEKETRRLTTAMQHVQTASHKLGIQLRARAGSFLRASAQEDAPSLHAVARTRVWTATVRPSVPSSLGTVIVRPPPNDSGDQTSSGFGAGTAFPLA